MVDMDDGENPQSGEEYTEAWYAEAELPGEEPSYTEALYTVGDVAEYYGISVRALHHWEKVGLIQPAERSWSNYRLYTEQDCSRIQQILIYRATGMKLAEIKDLLDSGDSNAVHLRRQKERIMRQKLQLDDMIAAIDTLLEDEMNEKKLTPEQIGAILGNAKFPEYQREAEEKYGESEDWAKSQEVASSWNREDWGRHKAQMDAVDAELMAAVREGVDPASDEAAELAEKHRAVLGEFFPVTHAKHYLISRGYTADERFRAYFEAKQAGLAEWLAEAIARNAEQNGVDLDAVEWN